MMVVVVLFLRIMAIDSFSFFASTFDKLKSLIIKPESREWLCSNEKEAMRNVAKQKLLLPTCTTMLYNILYHVWMVACIIFNIVNKDRWLYYIAQLTCMKENERKRTPKQKSIYKKRELVMQKWRGTIYSQTLNCLVVFHIFWLLVFYYIHNPCDECFIFMK